MSDENQHWVPKFLLRNFADTDGKLFRMDIRTDEVKKRPPKHLAAAPGFNEFKSEGDDVSYEDRLGRIESRAAPVLKRIVTGNSTAGLSDEDRSKIAEFLAAQSFRTEAFLAGMRLSEDRSSLGSLFDMLWKSAFIVVAQLQRRKLALMIIEHDDVFYLGDNPVVLQRSQDPSSGGELGFDIPGIEAHLPLTPKCALYMPCASTSDQIVSLYEDAVVVHKHERLSALKAGRLAQPPSPALHLAQRTIRNAYPIYTAFTQGHPVASAPENVENLNYLQCAWAHREIYSVRNDFTFAKHVFERTPQYREGIKTSVVGWPTPPKPGG